MRRRGNYVETSRLAVTWCPRCGAPLAIPAILDEGDEVTFFDCACPDVQVYEVVNGKLRVKFDWPTDYLASVAMFDPKGEWRGYPIR